MLLITERKPHTYTVHWEGGGWQVLRALLAFLLLFFWVAHRLVVAFWMSDNRLPDGSFYRFPFGLRGFGFFTRVPNRPHILNEKFPSRPAATTFSRTTTHEPGASFRVASPAFPLCWYWFHHLFSRTELSFIHESSPSPLGVVSKSSDRHRFRTRWRSLPPNSSRVWSRYSPKCGAQ